MPKENNNLGDQSVLQVRNFPPCPNFMWVSTFCLFVLTIPLLLGSAKTSIQVDRSDPTSILRAVKRHGAVTVVQQFTRNWNHWEEVLHHIGSGNRVWLKVAQALRPGTDAFSTTTLLLAVGQALPVAPEEVLRLVFNGKGFEFEDICTVPFLEPTDAVVLEYLTRVESALKKSMASDVNDLRLKCLASLQNFSKEFEVAQKTFEQYWADLANDNPEVRKNSLAKIVEAYNKEEERAVRFPSDDRFEKITNRGMQLLSDPDPSTRLLAIKVVAMSTDIPTRESVSKLFEDTDDEVRAAAAGVFVAHYVQDSPIMQGLERLLNDRNPKVRMRAAESLAGYRNSRTVKALLEAYAKESNEEVKGAIVDALGK